MTQERSLAEGECRRVWSGNLCSKSECLTQVELLWYTSEKTMDFPVPLGKELKMDKKLSLERFQRTFFLPNWASENSRALIQDSNSSCNQLYYCQLKEVAFAGSRRRKSVASYLRKRKLAGLGSIGVCGKVFFLPTCSLTHHYGLTSSSEKYPLVIHVIFDLIGCFYSDLCPLTTLCGILVHQMDGDHVNSALCIDEDDGCEQPDILSSKKSSNNRHFYLPIDENDVLLLDAMSSEDELHALPGMGCSDVMEVGLGRRKCRLTKQQRRHKKCNECAVPSIDHTSHSITTTAHTPPLTHSWRRASHETVEQSITRKNEDGVHCKESKESDSSLLVKYKCSMEEDGKELCGSDQHTLELIVSLPLRDVEHKTIGESSDQASSHTGFHRGGWGMQCAGEGEELSLNQESIDEEECNTVEQLDVFADDSDVDDTTACYCSDVYHPSVTVEPVLPTSPRDFIIQEEIVAFASSPSPGDSKKEEGHNSVSTTHGVSVTSKGAVPLPAHLTSEISNVASILHLLRLMKSVSDSEKMSEQELLIHEEPERDLNMGVNPSSPMEEGEDLPKAVKKIGIREYKKRKQQQKVEDVAVINDAASGEGSVSRIEESETAVNDQDVQGASELPPPEQPLKEVTQPLTVKSPSSTTPQHESPDTRILSALKGIDMEYEEEHPRLEGTTLGKEQSRSISKIKRTPSLQELSSPIGGRDPRSLSLKPGSIGNRGNRKSNDSVRPSSFSPTATAEGQNISSFASPVGTSPHLVVTATVKSPPSATRAVTDQPGIVAKQHRGSRNCPTNQESASEKKPKQQKPLGRLSPALPPVPPPLPPPLPEEPAPAPLPPPPLPKSDPPPEPPPTFCSSPPFAMRPTSPRPHPLFSNVPWCDPQIPLSQPMQPFLPHSPWQEAHLQQRDMWSMPQYPPPLIDRQPNQPPPRTNQSHFGREEGEQNHGSCVEFHPQSMCDSMGGAGKTTVADVPLVCEYAPSEEQSVARADSGHDEKLAPLAPCGESACTLSKQEGPQVIVSKKPVQTSSDSEEVTSEVHQQSPKIQRSLGSAVPCDDKTSVGVQVDMHDCVDSGVQCMPSVADGHCQVSFAEYLPQPQDALLEQLSMKQIVLALLNRMKDCGVSSVGEDGGRFLKAMSEFEDRLRQDIATLLPSSPVGSAAHAQNLHEKDEAVCHTSMEQEKASMSTPPLRSEEDEVNDVEMSHINKAQKEEDEPQMFLRFDVVSPPSDSSVINSPPCTSEMPPTNALAALFDNTHNRASSPPLVTPVPVPLPDSTHNSRVSSPPPSETLPPVPQLDNSNKLSIPHSPVKPALAPVVSVNHNRSSSPPPPVGPPPAVSASLTALQMEKDHSPSYTEQPVYMEVLRIIEESKAGSCKERKESLSPIYERKESLSPISDEDLEEYNDVDLGSAQPAKPSLHNHTSPHDSETGLKGKVRDPSEASEVCSKRSGARDERVDPSPVRGSSSVTDESAVPAVSKSGGHESRTRSTSLEMGPPATPIPQHTALKEDTSEVSRGSSLEQSASTASSTHITTSSSAASQRGFKRKTHTAGASLSLNGLLGDSNLKATSSTTKPEAKADDGEDVSLPSKPKTPSQLSSILHPNWMERDTECKKEFKLLQAEDPPGAKKKKKKKKKAAEVDRLVDRQLEQFQEDKAKGVVSAGKGARKNATDNIKAQQWKYGGVLHSVDGKGRPASAKVEKANNSPRKSEEKYNGNGYATTHSDNDSGRQDGRTRKSENNKEYSRSSGRNTPPYKRRSEKRAPAKTYSPRRHCSSDDSWPSRSGRHRSRSRSPRRDNGHRASPPSHQSLSKKEGLRKRRYSRSPPRIREKSLDLSSSYQSASSDDESPRSKRYRSSSDLDRQSSVEALSSRKWPSSNKYSRDEPVPSIFDTSDPKRALEELWGSSASASDTAVEDQPSFWDDPQQMVAEDGFDSGRYSRSITPPQAVEPRHLAPVQPYIGQ